MLRNGANNITTYGVILVATALSAMQGHAQAQDEHAKVVSHIEAYAIEQDDAGQEIRLTAESINPGGIIEYHMTYTNISDASLAQFVIQGDVPNETTYVSAGEVNDAPAIFEVSVADIGWASPPVIRYVEDNEGILRPVEVPDEEFEALRWRLVEPINPGEVVSATYRIKVEN